MCGFAVPQFAASLPSVVTKKLRPCYASGKLDLPIVELARV